MSRDILPLLSRSTIPQPNFLVPKKFDPPFSFLNFFFFSRREEEEEEEAGRSVGHASSLLSKREFVLVDAHQLCLCVFVFLPKNIFFFFFLIHFLPIEIDFKLNNNSPGYNQLPVYFK